MLARTKRSRASPSSVASGEPGGAPGIAGHVSSERAPCAYAPNALNVARASATRPSFVAPKVPPESNRTAQPSSAPLVHPRTNPPNGAPLDQLSMAPAATHAEIADAAWLSVPPPVG